MVRAFIKDGADGPDMYVYSKLEKDTLFKSDKPHLFPKAKAHQMVDSNMVVSNNKGENTIFSELIKAYFGKDCQLLIIHNDTIVYDQVVHPFKSGANATVFSITKSITSLLCGIAVDEGYIKDVKDPVTNYLPELKRYNPTYEQLTIEHLLNMQAGFDFDELYELKIGKLRQLNKIATLQYGKDFTRLFKKMKFKHQPGEKYEYQSITTGLLSWLLERATGKTFAQYATEKVWKPLGMQQNSWITIDSKKHHHAHGFGGLATNVYDLAKIGRLYMQGGEWNGQQIVSTSWIDRSLMPSKENKGYHYKWYYKYYDDSDRESQTFYALGIGHKLLYLNKEKNVIIVWIGNAFNSPINEVTLFDKLCDRIF